MIFIFSMDGISDRPAKRKRIVVSMVKKLEAIDRINNGESQKKVAIEYGVGETTVGDWKRNHLEIREYCNKCQSKDILEYRCTLKKAKLSTLDDALFLWFQEQRARGLILSGSLLQEKAKALNEELGGDENFTASHGWLNRFKTRHGIRLNPVGELSASPEPDATLNSSSEEAALTEVPLPEVEIETGNHFLIKVEPCFTDSSTEWRGAQNNSGINHVEGVDALNNALQYLTQRSDVPSEDLLVLSKWRDQASADSVIPDPYQKLITDFFHKL